MATTKNKVFALSAPVTITAGATEGEKTGLPRFESVFYTGGAIDLAGWESPVVIDLAGVSQGNVLVANLDHDSSKRVGNFTAANDGKQLMATGFVTAATPASDEVVKSAANGYQWQSSIEANVNKLEMVKAEKTVSVNGQNFSGPLYVVRKSTLKGFAFVSHGADDNTTVSIAAHAASIKENRTMKAEAAAWIQGIVPGIDIEAMDADQVAHIEAQYDGREPPKKTKKTAKADRLDATVAEAERVEAITEIAVLATEKRKYDSEFINAVKEMRDNAIEAQLSPDKFRIELLEKSIGVANVMQSSGRRSPRTSQKVIEAALLQAGRYDREAMEKQYDDQTLQAAHDAFPYGIGLNEMICVCAEANGHRVPSHRVTPDILRAAWGVGPAAAPTIRADGVSTVSLPNILSNVANKFLMVGRNAIDQTPLRIARIRSVKDFKQTTTVSLTGGLLYKQIGPDGQIKSSELGDLKYNNQAYTYAIMNTITRTDIINDDTGALTTAPERLGRGGMLKLNDIFWTTFLNNSSFFTSGNNNTSTGGGSALTSAGGGISAAETKFMDQTDPDGYPLGIMPAILLVPPTLKAAAMGAMNSQFIVSGNTSGLAALNVFQGRYSVESSPYMENSNYTGYSTAAWYLLASPGILPVIEIAALNGRVEPTVETSTAEFDTLGIAMRGYTDIGVSTVEYRGGVRSAGS